MLHHSSALKGNMDAELKIVLLGKTGSGKSATGNTILGRNAFETASSASSTTQLCKREQATHGERTVVVVDTPGYFNTNGKEKFTKKEMRACIGDLRPGPDAIIFAIRVGRITQEDKQIINKVKELFNKEGKYFLVVLFTCIDYLETTLQDFIDKADNDLRDLLAMAEGRYVGFNNKAGEDERSRQVTALFEVIDALKRRNGGKHYTEERFNNDLATCPSCTVL